MTDIVATASPSLDNLNAEFWDEICGTTFARARGITGDSLEMLARFDRAYLEHYPFLLKRVPVGDLVGKDVLEVGLGYGTLSQVIVESGAAFTGLDIAAGPVKMVNHRLRMRNLPGLAVQGNMLHAPIASNSQDVVISIGCFHHTGNLQRCIDETFRVLRPGGVARIMVYNGLSYYQWRHWPRETFQLWRGVGSQDAAASAELRAAYDSSSAQEAAPETTFVSARQLAAMFRQFSDFHCWKENCFDLSPRWQRLVPRAAVLPTLGRLAGISLYVEARKG